MAEQNPLEYQAVVTAFLRHQGKILLLRRSDRVRTYRGCWAGVSGYLEAPTPLEQALREIREETGLSADHVHLVREGAPIEVPAPALGTCWVVHPLLFEVENPRAIQIDWEHREARWVDPAELKYYPTVPALAQALESCLEPEEGRDG